MIGYIYVTSNEINDIAYVGKRQKPYVEKCYKGSGTHLKLAFAKYGKDKFHTTVLQRCDTKEELCEAEKNWIALYRALGIELYNITDGGEGTAGISWKRYAPDRIEEILEKNRAAHMGKKNPFYGRHHSEATKAILREKNRRKTWPKELKEYKEKQRAQLPKVAQYDKTTGELIAIWDNWCDAGKAVSKNSRCGFSHIAQCCKHEHKSAYGYRWEFAEKECSL